MHRQLIRYIFALIVCLTGFSVRSEAQFKEKAFEQTYNDQVDSTATADSAVLFSIKEFFGGLAHKNTVKIGTMFAGSAILPGTAQIYNKDYWKLPIVYGGIGALAGTGGYYYHRYSKSQKAYDQFEIAKNEFETKYKAQGLAYPFKAPTLDLEAKKKGTWLLAGAGLLYWATLLDGVLCYESDKNPDPGRATIYSVLFPGLGQIYNGELYKVPIYWGGLMLSADFMIKNNMNYKRFKRIHNEATTPDSGYNESISAETAKWYRDVYRRYRDYSIVATAAVYLLQVIDANVFAYMHDFEVTDELTMNVSPTVILPHNEYAMSTPITNGSGSSAIGMRIGFTF
ncbi:MAG: hypothetical protein IKU36_08750 [Bacteroidales bacterium]|nr:hypothetical protein [Bacteroidales bacterium]